MYVIFMLERFYLLCVGASAEGKRPLLVRLINLLLQCANLKTLRPKGTNNFFPKGVSNFFSAVYYMGHPKICQSPGLLETHVEIHCIGKNWKKYSGRKLLACFGAGTF